MGSRRGRYAALVALLGASAACSRSGAPSGFPEGTSWTIPLVGPLEEGLLLVPALVNGRGPFLFAIDTDAQVSAIDTEVVEAIGPRTGEGPKLVDETNVERDRFYAEILEWQLGTLSVTNKPAQILQPKSLDLEGRRIHGVIGRDVLADALTFSFDRDAGEITLTTKTTFKPNPASQVAAYSTLATQSTNVETLPQSRKVVDATINGEPFKLHVDFGATASQLRARSWTQAKLTESPLSGGVVDEVGTPRKVDKSAIAAEVAIGAALAKDVAFIPYADRRWPIDKLEGTLGLDFFKPFDVTVDWTGSQIYLRPREAVGDATARIGRWHSKTLSGCANVGCVKVALIDPVASVPEAERPATHPGVVASVSRDASAKELDLEVLVAVTAADGTPLKWLIINMPAGVERTLAHLPASYVGASTTILDASPFPRACPKAAVENDGERAPDATPSPHGGCIDLLTPPQALAPAAASN